MKGIPKIHKTYRCAAAVCASVLVLACGQATSTDDVTPVQGRKVDANEILSSLKQTAELVTTEVQVRKICIYDSSKKEKFQWADPSTWRYGERMCVVPIEVTIKYGYDLREMTTDNIKLSDDSTEVRVMLPKAKVVDAGYNVEVNDDETVRISTGLRHKIGHELVEQVRRKGYEAVMQEDFSQLLEGDVTANAQSVMESVVKGLGFENVVVVVDDDTKERRRK